jgi:hypothetical protein
MTPSLILWMTLFAVFAACFFGVAAVVAVKGWADLKALLDRSARHERPPER